MNTFITLHICNLQSQNYFHLGKTRSFPLKLEKPQNVHYCLQYMVQIFKRNQDEISKEEMTTVQFLTGNFQKIISGNRVRWLSTKIIYKNEKIYIYTKINSFIISEK